MMDRVKKDGTVVTTLQAYVSPTNKKWLAKHASKEGVKISPFLDKLLTEVRKSSRAS